MYAHEMVDIEHVSAGNICAVIGLKHVRTGDTLVHAHDNHQVCNMCFAIQHTRWS